jgi:hypothetical protein
LLLLNPIADCFTRRSPIQFNNHQSHSTINQSNQQSPINNQQSHDSLALPMSRVLAAEAAEFREFQPLRGLLLVLRRAVVAPLALGARERDDVSHGCDPIFLAPSEETILRQRPELILRVPPPSVRYGEPP